MRLGNPSDSSSNSNKKPIINFTIFSENVVKEINKVRTNPLEYMGKLKKLAKINNEGELEFNGILIKLRENKKSFNEALDFLSKQEKVNKLTIKNGIIKSVEDLMKVLIIKYFNSITSTCYSKILIKSKKVFHKSSSE